MLKKLSLKKGIIFTSIIALAVMLAPAVFANEADQKVPPASRITDKIIVTDADTIDRTKDSIKERYADAKQINILHILDLVEVDEGIQQKGNTFINTLEVPGGKSNRYVRIGFKDGVGMLDLTALNGSSGQIGVHISAGVDVSRTTNGMYVYLKDDVNDQESYVTSRHAIDWRNYTKETAVFDTMFELETTLWDVDQAYIEVLLPYQAEITIQDIFMFVEKEVPGFSDMHERITGGAEAVTDNIHVIHNAAEFAEALDKVSAAGVPSIIYVNGTVSYEEWVEATGKKQRDITIGSEVQDLSIIGIADRGIFNGSGLKIHGHNIIIENLTIQYVEGKDGIEVNNATDVWIRHNSFIDGGRDLPEGIRFDELMSIKNNSQHVIVSWNHFKDSNRVLLVGSNDGLDALPDRRLIMHHNYIENVTQRVPLYRGGHAHMYNNYIKNVNLSASNVRSNAKMRIENNYFEDVRDPIGDFHGLIPGRWEVNGNIFDNSTGSQPTESTIAINFKDYEYDLDPTEEVPDIVSNGAGAGKIEQDLAFIERLVQR
ncbi:polysaccharide lyase family 1 protein [Paenibacillus tarimensis]